MPGFRCETCAINVNSQQQFTQHLSGKSHMRKVKEKIAAGGTWDPAALAASKPKLYGSFVPASGAKEDENDTNSINKESPKPASSPSQVTVKKPLQLTEQDNVVQSQTVSQTKTQINSQPGTQSLATQIAVTNSHGSLAPSVTPVKLVNTIINPYEQTVTPQTLAKTNVNPARQSNVNPVVQAVVDNALGKLPTKRKQYEGMCSVCKVTFNSPSQESQHFQGSKHAKKVKLMKVAPENVSIEKSSTFICQFCNVTVNSLAQFEAHRLGGKHLANFGKFKAAQTGNFKNTDTSAQTNTASHDQHVVSSA